MLRYNQLTTQSFIEKAVQIHGDKYDYSKVEYINSKTKVCIICPEHGEFWQVPASHLQKRGCPICSNIKKKLAKIDDKNSFIEKAKKIHGDEYDYSKVEYIDSYTKVCIICTKHGEFWQSPNNHLRYQGCPSCYDDKRKNIGTNNKNTFIEKAKEVHGDKYDYSKIDYKNVSTKISIICPKHGEFLQRPDHHLNGCGCPRCCESKLEREIRNYCDKHHITYEYQKKFKWLGKQSLDFYLPKYNTAIECQGVQHFNPVKRFGGNLAYEKQIKLDARKKQKCIEHGLKLVYYGHIDNLDDISHFTNKDKLFKTIKEG